MSKFHDTSLQLIRPPLMSGLVWHDLVASVHRDLCALGATDVKIDHLTAINHVLVGARFPFDCELADCDVILQLLLDKYVELELLP